MYLTNFINSKMRKSILLLILLGWQACTYETLTVINCEENPVVIAEIISEDTDCGEQNGSIKISATGGSGNFRYQVNDGPVQTDSTFTGLGTGSYIVTVLDGRCEVSEEVAIGNKTGVNIDNVTVISSGCNTENGSISIEASGGTPPYSYRIDAESFQSANVFTSLAQGSYTVTVRDQDNCEAVRTATIHSGVTFSGDIQPIIQTKCAINDCHNGTSSLPNFNIFSNLKARANLAKEYTQSGYMPYEGGPLPQAQIDAIACWVDDGAPEN